MSKKYHSGSHCRYLLKVHLIFVTKYRKKIIANASDFAIEIMETDKDHMTYSSLTPGTKPWCG